MDAQLEKIARQLTPPQAEIVARMRAGWRLLRYNAKGSWHLVDCVHRPAHARSVAALLRRGVLKVVYSPHGMRLQLAEGWR